MHVTICQVSTDVVTDILHIYSAGKSVGGGEETTA